MKLFAFILLCALTYYVRADNKHDKEKLVAAVNECKEKHGATDEDALTVFTFVPAVSTNAKCMRACALKKFNLINEDGKFVKDANMKFFSDVLQGDAAKVVLSDELVVVCNDIKVSEDHCEAAEEYIACVKKESEARSLKIF